MNMTMEIKTAQVRRDFLKTTMAGATAIAAMSMQPKPAHAAVKMYKNLGHHHIGVSGNQMELIDMASRFGFGGVNVNTGELVKMSKEERAKVVSTLHNKGLQWGIAGVPVDFRKDEETFKKGMATLPKKAEVLQSVGVTRMPTWILSGHNELTYRENFELHRKRLTQIANVLKAHDLRLGLEFVGPQTFMNTFQYPFIHTQKEMLELCDAVGTGNVGLLLDSFHWYTSHGTVDELLALTPEMLVEVHVNDGRKGRGPDEQIDNQRRLPTTTGVIPIKKFINAMAKIGYDGPVTCEPFDQELRDKSNKAALAETIKALDNLFDMIEA
jgi:sugar phosphate isomerase/epimerase